MNRLVFLLISTAFVMLTTLMVDSLGLASPENPVGEVATDVDNSVGSIFSILGTFIDIMTFQVDDIPVLFNMVFAIVTIGMVYIIVMIIKDVIPFT